MDADEYVHERTRFGVELCMCVLVKGGQGTRVAVGLKHSIWVRNEVSRANRGPRADADCVVKLITEEASGSEVRHR